MAETLKMSLAEAANLCKKLERDYRVFEKTAEAAKVVLSAYNEVDAVQASTVKAKGQLAELETEVAKLSTEAEIQKAENKELQRGFASTQANLDKLVDAIADLEPRLERDLATVESKLATTKKAALATLEKAKEAKASEVTQEINGLEARRKKLQDQVDSLGQERADLKTRLEAGLAQVRG